MPLMQCPDAMAGYPSRVRNDDDMTTSTQLPWVAPLAPGPVRATVTVPGSKSITNRALLLAALAGTGGTVRGALRSRDTDLMVGALRALGVPVTSRPNNWTPTSWTWPRTAGCAPRPRWTAGWPAP